MKNLTNFGLNISIPDNTITKLKKTIYICVWTNNFHIFLCTKYLKIFQSDQCVTFIFVWTWLSLSFLTLAVPEKLTNAFICALFGHSITRHNVGHGTSNWHSKIGEKGTRGKRGSQAFVFLCQLLDTHISFQLTGPFGPHQFSCCCC